MGLSIKWDITYKCNLRCKHCINGNFLGDIENELNTEQILHVIDKIGNLKFVDYVHLLGGEPTTLKDFVTVTGHFENNKIKFGFNTNGLKLTDSDFLKVLHNKYLSSIVVSLEGPNQEVNDKIRGKNVYDKIVSGLEHIKSYRKEHNLDHFKICINTVISKDNYMYISDMIDLAIDLGAGKISFLGLIEDGFASDSKLSLSTDELLESIKCVGQKYEQVKEQITIVPKFVRPLAIDYCKEVLNIEFPNITHMCGAGTNFAYMNNNGELFPCDRYRSLVLEGTNRNDINLFNNTFNEIWKNDIYSEAFALTEGDEFYKKYTPCNTCKYIKKGCYPCPVDHRNSENVFMKECTKYVELINKSKEVAI